jgi:hypothetical protein
VTVQVQPGHYGGTWLNATTGETKRLHLLVARDFRGRRPKFLGTATGGVITAQESASAGVYFDAFELKWREEERSRRR